VQTNCPHCGRLNDQHATDEDKPPSEGDVSLCWKCGGAALFTTDGVRKPTIEEEADISQDPDVKKFRYAMAESFTPSQAVRMVRGEHD
jgi:hypothetical protein